MKVQKREIKKKDGSKIAKGGLKYEHIVIGYLNNWNASKDGQNILLAMGYDLDDIEWVKSESSERRRKRLYQEYGITLHHNQKADIVADIKTKSDEKIRTETISAKSVTKNLDKKDKRYAGFGQVDKRPVESYAQLWSLATESVKTLKYFTGELAPYKEGTKKPERMFLNELKPEEAEALLNELEEKKVRIFYDTFMGKGPLSAKWIIVGLKQVKGLSEVNSWTIHRTINIINFYCQGKTKMSKQGSIKFGKITIQRKGGDNGSKSGDYLQFKLDPLLLMRDKQNRK